MKLVEAKDLKKDYNGKTAVSSVCFYIDEGEIFGLLGPNGAGKTTTVSMLSCLLKPTEGDAFISGKSITKEPMEVKKLIGVVPQEIALYSSLTARENLNFFGRMYNLSGVKLKDRVDGVLEIVGLKDRANEVIDKYSGGMKRRINIAVGLLPEPELLILDEPTVGVDPQSRNHILETLKKLNEDGLTILYTSHYMEEVEFLCKRVAIMDLGKIIATGTQEELKNMVGKTDSVKIQLQDELNPLIKEKIAAVESVDKVILFDKTLEVLTKKGRKVVADLINLLDDEKVRIKSVDIEEPNLESLFLHLTGKNLRD